MSEIEHRPGILGTRSLASGSRAREHVSDASAEQRWSRSYRARLVVSDTFIVILSVAIAFVARFGVAQGGFGNLSRTYWLVAIVIVAVWSLLLVVLRTRDSQVIGVGAVEYRRVAAASAFAFGALAIIFLVGKIELSRGFFVLAMPLGLVSLTLSRWLWRRWLSRQRVRGHYLSRAVVVGSPPDVEYVVDQLSQHSGAMYNIVGIAIDSAAFDHNAFAAVDAPVVADLSTIATAAANLQADTVIVAGHTAGNGTFIRDLSWQLEGAATELVLASRLTDVAGPRIHFRPMDGLPLIHVEIPQFEGGKHVVKRVFDIVVSGIALILLSPLFLVLALLVRADSPGGAVFSQQRVGRNGRPFTIRKFRSMFASAESDLAALAVRNEGSGALFKLKADPRITRIGHALRKYSLDELPQLWNVFIGNMSLVGPRPPLPTEVQAYEDDVHRRLFIRPGLTGMWQINGRSDLSWDESVRLDLYYVENWSLMGDIIIMWRTFRVVFRAIGAY